MPENDEKSVSELRPLVLLTGATGYVGGRLLNKLKDRSGHRIRCLARVPDNVRVGSGGRVEVVQGDLLDRTSLELACRGVETAFFLAHSLGAARGFEAQERKCAENFAAAAAAQGVKKIIYLGGLGAGQNLSSHLKTRQEVGDILRSSKIPVIEFRASIIIGSGSLSFELVRSLTEKLPVMITPKWVYSKAQPIAIRDVLAYLVAGLETNFEKSEIFEIGGPDKVAYVDLMVEYARQRELKRFMIPAPFLSPRLSSLWLGLVTPVYARIGRKLVDSLRNDTVVSDNRALTWFNIVPIGMVEAIALALKNEDSQLAETRWCDALSSGRGLLTYGGLRFGSRLVDVRSSAVATTLSEAFLPIQEIGGKRGWYFANTLWRIRGLVDILAGGVGLRRGRKHAHNIDVGDTIDFWRVEQFEPNHLLRLRAEMKLPGRAWLQFEVSSQADGLTKVTQTAIFDPLGLSGLLYWYALYPVHGIIFQGMLDAVVARVLVSKA